MSSCLERKGTLSFSLAMPAGSEPLNYSPLPKGHPSLTLWAHTSFRAHVAVPRAEAWGGRAGLRHAGRAPAPNTDALLEKVLSSVAFQTLSQKFNEKNT